MESRSTHETQLIDSDAFLRAAMDALPVAVIVAEGVAQTVLFMNRKFTEMFGYTIEDVPDVEHWWPLAFPEPEYQTKMRAVLEEYGRHGLARTTKPSAFEGLVTARDGRVLCIEFRVTFLGQRSIVTFSDITDRRRAEEALQRKEALSASLLALSGRLERADSYEDVVGAVAREIESTLGHKTAWVYLLSEDGEHARLIDAAGRFSGPISQNSQELQVKGDRMMEDILYRSNDIVIVEDARADARTNKQIVKQLDNRTIINVPILLFDRRLGAFGTGTFGDEGVRIPDAAEKEYLIAMANHLAVTLDRVHSMGERRKAEDSMRRFNRALQTLSNGNEALVRAVDEQSLIDDMCSVLVRYGGYQAALIVLHSEGHEDLTAWSAASGIPEYLKHACTVAAKKGSLTEGKMDQPIVVHNVHELNAAEGLQEAALSAGMKSFASLPVHDGQNLIGMFALFSQDPAEFNADEMRLLEELAGDLSYGVHTLRLRIDRRKHHERLTKAMESAIQALASALELRDQYTAGHQRRVAELAAAIGRRVGLPEAQIRGLYLAGVVHDIGKIYVPAEILTRPGRLSAVEFALVKTHVDAGYEILKGIDFPWPIAEIVWQHHENMDGTGYPRGLAGDSILIEARILSVADMVEAITNHRPYRPALGIETAFQQLRAASGTRLDAAIVDACIAVFQEDKYEFHRQ